jgi:glucosamine-6-phosphate deaminase
MDKERIEPLVTVHPQSIQGAAAVALELVDLVEANPRAVLGLATGATMVEVYAAVVAESQQRALDFSRVTTFNLDEFVGLPAASEHSFRTFMNRHLHGPLGIDAERALFPDEELARTSPTEAARRYEDAIHGAGGIDFQLLGLGRNGHVGFNEPGAAAASRTRVVELHGVTRQDAASAFGGLANTPGSAITMGIATILDARAIRLLAFGNGKAAAVRQLLRGNEDAAWPCTYLRGRHEDLSVHLDPGAAQELS